MLTLDSKLPNVGTTIFTRMSQLAHDCGAINLGQGFPDFNGPQALLERVTHHLQAGHNQYSPLAGVAGLRSEIASKVARLYQRTVCMDTEVSVVAGATEGLFCAITATVKKGDEVIVFDPAYDSYEPAIELAGGHCVHIPLTPPGFAVDWQRLQDAITDRTRMIVVNTPHNPAGTTFARQDWDRLADLIRDRNILILSDEVYEHLIFDGESHCSVLCHEELAERAFAIFSFGKTYHVTGWKTGYVVAPQALTKELLKVHQYVTFVGVTPLQYALADYMKSCPEHYLELPGFYQEKRDLLCRLLAQSRFQFRPATATFFQLLDYSAINDVEDVEMAGILAREAGVAAIPISVFYKTPLNARYLRLCFAKQDDTLSKAAEKLCAL